MLSRRKKNLYRKKSAVFITKLTNKVAQPGARCAALIQGHTAYAHIFMLKFMKRKKNAHQCCNRQTYRQLLFDMSFVCNAMIIVLQVLSCCFAISMSCKGKTKQMVKSYGDLIKVEKTKINKCEIYCMLKVTEQLKRN